MPIIVKDYTWRQTETTVTIQVPLKGIHSSKVDVFTSQRYLKLSYIPFFFDVLLQDEVDTLKSSCTFTKDSAVFELTKVEPKKWTNLESDLPRKERNDLKQKFVEQTFEKFQKECENKSNKKHELKRVAVREQIALETRQRHYVEEVKTQEKNNALGNLAQWQKALTDSTEAKIISSDESDFEVESEDDEIKINQKPLEELPKETVHPIRKSTNVTVTFSKRELPTPCRESRLEEESEWLRNQALARRSVGFDGDDLRPEEKNPQHVRCKGDDFLKQGNYLGAISAYTFGIQLSPKYVDLYMGRLAAHFAIGNFQRCAQDCSTALDLMKPEVPINLEQRITCIFKRGISIFKLGFKEKGADELRAALRLKPNNKEIEMELEKMVDEIEDEQD